MNAYDMKTVADAAAELSRKTTQNLTEASVKAWKDFHAFGDTVAKAQSEVLKGFGGGQAYGDFYATVSKFQAEALKSFSNMFNTTTTK